MLAGDRRSAGERIGGARAGIVMGVVRDRSRPLCYERPSAARGVNWHSRQFGCAGLSDHAFAIDHDR